MSTRAPRRRRLRRPKAGGPHRPMDRVAITRLMWRTGFGPTARDLKRFKGRSLQQAVEMLLSAPQGRLAGQSGSRRADKRPLDPPESDRDLVLEWCDRMIRTPNPLIERLSLMWHNHFATDRREVSPPQLMTRQNALFRRYSDFAAFPTANFPRLIREVGKDPAMMRFLNNEENTAEDINENYGRELMELFCLGPTDVKGNDNYDETDVREVSKALTGWELETENPEVPMVEFNPDNHFGGDKLILGKRADFDYESVHDQVLDHYSHPRFIVTSIWSEFHPEPPDEGTVKDLMRVYERGRRRLRPVVARVLTHSSMLRSLKEPNMIKSPVVYAVGLMRTLRLTIDDDTLYNALNDMGQLPYFPPTVAGWEGGVEWLNTNTTTARFDLASRLLEKAYAKADPVKKAPADVEDESPTEAFKRARAAVGTPWLARGTKSALLYFSKSMDAERSHQRIARQRVLRAFMLGGPDAQVT